MVVPRYEEYLSRSDRQELVMRLTASEWPRWIVVACLAAATAATSAQSRWDDDFEGYEAAYDGRFTFRPLAVGFRRLAAGFDAAG